MKITVYTKEFQEVLKKAFKFAPKKSSFELINKSVFIKAINDILYVGATNFDNSVVYNLDATVENEAYCVFSENTIKLINKLDSDTITITDSEIIAGNRKLKYTNKDISMVSDVLFVNTKDIYCRKLFYSTKEEYMELLSTTFATSKQESSPILQGVCLRGNKAIATDRHRMMIKPFITEVEHDVIISADVLDYSSTLLKSYNGFIESHMDYDNQKLIIKFDNVEIQTRLVDGNYPDVSRIIPDSNNASVELDTKEFEKELKLSIEISDKTNVVRIKSDNDTLSIITKDDENELTSDINTLKNENEMEFAVNAKYILDGINFIKSNIIKIDFISSLRPILINDCYIVLPYRLT